MIIYDKLANLLKERNMMWKDLCNSGISVNVPSKLSHNKIVSMDTIDKICEYLKVQPSEIMEWVSCEDYEKMLKLKEKKNLEKLEIEAQIAELQKKLKNM